MPDLATAIELATEAHTGQLDKAGRPYIEHPMAVMAMVNSETQKIIAVLHDTVEDTWVTLGQLTEIGFSDDVVIAVDAVTKRPGETLEQSMGRVMAEPSGDALVVKRADVAHNAGRIDALADEVMRIRLRKKYERTAKLLGTSLTEILASHRP